MNIFELTFLFTSEVVPIEVLSYVFVARILRMFKDPKQVLDKGLYILFPLHLLVL